MPLIVLLSILSISCLLVLGALWLVCSIDRPPQNSTTLKLSDEQVRQILGSLGKSKLDSKRRNAEAMHTVNLN